MATFANLRELNVCESRINDNHLVGVLRICKTLPILNVSGCTGITDFGFKKAFQNEGLFSSTFPIVHFTCNRAVDKPHHRNLGTNASKHCTVNSILKCTRCTCYSYLVHLCTEILITLHFGALMHQAQCTVSALYYFLGWPSWTCH